MTRTLFVLRHAKSDWNSGVPDHARPLNKRGRKAAELVGRFLARTEQQPERVLVSSAERARTTVERAMDAGAWDCAVEVTDDLYETSVADVLELLRAQDARVERLMVAGHDPTVGALVALLVGEATLRFPTAGLARLDFEIADWSELREGSGSLAWFVVPRLLADLEG